MNTKSNSPTFRVEYEVNKLDHYTIQAPNTRAAEKIAEILLEAEYPDSNPNVLQVEEEVSVSAVEAALEEALTRKTLEIRDLHTGCLYNFEGEAFHPGLQGGFAGLVQSITSEGVYLTLRFCVVRDGVRISSQFFTQEDVNSGAVIITKA